MISTMRPTSVDQRGMFGQKPKIHPVLAKKQEVEHEPTEEPLEELPEEIPTEEPLEELPEEIPTEEAPTTEPILEDSENESTEETPKEEASSTMTESFECPNCNAEFDNKRSLNGHMLKYTRGNNKNN